MDSKPMGYDAQQIIQSALPAGAKVIVSGSPYTHAQAGMADLNGDGMPEAVGAYRTEDGIYALVMQHDGTAWKPAARVKGSGYQVQSMHAAPMTSDERNNLIAGWQQGAAWSTLAVYEWTPQGLVDISGGRLSYSHMEVIGHAAAGGRAAVALWQHDTAEAYRVEVYMWDGTALAPAQQLYPYYYPKVVRYYQSKVQTLPSVRYYWYYLADAQLKAGMADEAAVSADKAMELPGAYPSDDVLLQLMQAAQSGSMMRGGWLYPASVKTASGTKWGYINAQGHMEISPQFEYAYDYQSNGLAIVQLKDRSGVINMNGEYVVKPVYESISPYSEGRAAAVNSKGYVVIDEAGRVRTPNHYEYIGSYRSGRAAFARTNASGNWKYGYLDRQGKEVIAPIYDEAGDFHDGKAVVRIQEKEYALIGLDGERLASYPYAFVGSLSEGLLPYQPEQPGKYGYIDESGKTVIAPQYTSAMPFREGHAIVNVAEDYGSQYGLINREGQFTIPAEYQMINQLGEQRVALGRPINEEEPYLGYRYALAGQDGGLLTDYRFHDIQEYKQGLASVYDAKQTYLLDRSGKPAPLYPKVEGSGTLTLMGDLVQANVDQRLLYYDRDGEMIWRQNTIIPLHPPYKVKERTYKPNKDYLVYYPEVLGMADRKAQRTVNERLKTLSRVRRIQPNDQLDFSYTGDFEVTFFKEELLVLELSAYNYPFGAAHGMPSLVYPHIQLRTGRFFELKDLFKPGSDYVQVLSAIIGEQIATDPQYEYVFPDSYQGIAPDQPFYVTERALHLYFEPYEIGPYAAGFPTFTIPFEQIRQIIHTKGEFWRSFH